MSKQQATESLTLYSPVRYIEKRFFNSFGYLKAGLSYVLWSGAAASLLYCIWSMVKESAVPDPYLWPVASAGIILFLEAGGLHKKTAVQVQKQMTAAVSTESDITSVLQFGCALLIYAISVCMIGFSLSTLCFILAMSRGVSLKLRLTYSLITTIFVMAVFTRLLYVPFPLGIGVFREIGEFITYRVFM